MTNTIKPADNSYTQYLQWDKSAAPAIFKAQTEKELSAACEQAGLFDFQQGQGYMSSLHALAAEEVNANDINQDGSVSYEEFLEQGKNEYKDILSEATIKELEESNIILMQFFAKDIDIDDKISAEDLELFYSIADESLASEANKRVKDGKFSQEDLSQAMELMLNMLQEENPQLEQELTQRSEEIYNKKSELKNILGYDIDKDKEIQQEEFMLAMEKIKGDSPEAKAGAYCVWQIMNSVIGDDSDKKGTLDIGDIGSYIEAQYDSGFDAEGYYNYLLQNFTNKDAPNYGYYQQVLNAYKSLV